MTSFLFHEAFSLRFAWVRLMKTKTAAETLKAFKDILKSAEGKPYIILSDKGSEVQNSLFRSFCEAQGIRLITNQTSYKGIFILLFNLPFKS